ncbi:MAG: phage portal protein [Gemmatimonadota bacterium]
MSWLERLETKGLSINRLHEDLDSGFTPASAYRLKTGTVTDSMGADVVMSPVFWVVNNFTEADAVVQRRTRTGQWERTEDHALEMLLEQPNPFYDGDALWSATLVSYLLEGDAYWQKVRNAYGDVIGLWYLPHFLVEPVREDGSGDFITSTPRIRASGPTPSGSLCGTWSTSGTGSTPVTRSTACRASSRCCGRS